MRGKGERRGKSEVDQIFFGGSGGKQTTTDFDRNRAKTERKQHADKRESRMSAFCTPRSASTGFGTYSLDGVVKHGQEQGAENETRAKWALLLKIRRTFGARSQPHSPHLHFCFLVPFVHSLWREGHHRMLRAQREERGSGLFIQEKRRREKGREGKPCLGTTKEEREKEQPERNRQRDEERRGKRETTETTRR